MDTTGSIIRRLREEKNISSKEFSKIVDINQSTYSKLENDRKSIGVEELRKICGFYNISADIILELNDDSDHVLQYMTKNKMMSAGDISEVESILAMVDEAISLKNMLKRY
ncbi:MAG: helix-turn-helix transcriptional regulator [Clostridia bacterium]|nr:helix-turn-helix transcriptional regulator [Clostridia bacterium]